MARSAGVGDRDRYPVGRQSLREVEAAEIEAQFGAQHGEVAADVIGGLGGRVGDKVDAAALQISEDPGTGLVARRNGEGIGGPGPDAQPLGPPPPRAARGAEHEIDAAVVAVQAGADRHAAPELQLPQVIADLREVLIVQFSVQRGEQPREPVGPEFPRMIVGDLP